MKQNTDNADRAKAFIKAYNSIIEKYIDEDSDSLHLGTFLATKDRFHSLFNKVFLEVYFSDSDPALALGETSVVGSSIKWTFYLIRNFFCILHAKFSYLKVSLSYDKNPSFKSISLIKSFAFDRSFENQDFRDDFFGDLADYLESKGMETLTVVDPLNSTFKNITKLSKIKQKVIPFQVFNSPLDIIRVKLRILKAFLVPPSGQVTYNGIDLTAVLKAQFRKDLFNPILLQGILMGYAFQRILERYPVENLYMTFENLNWERPMIKSIRKLNRDIKILGFQHAIVAQSSLNYFLSGNEKKDSLPDIILTNGEATREILEEYGDYRDIELRVGCALRQKHIFAYKPTERNIKRVLLIALEGTLETVKCANYVFKHIEQLENWEIVIRTHPILPFEVLKNYLAIDISEYKNIKVSKNGILDDLNICSVVIYWGTTLSIEALALGIPVIHYSSGSYLSYDPLFKLDKFKWTMTEEDDLFGLLERIISMPDEEFNGLKEESLEYVKKYFFNINEENLSSFIP